MLDDRDTKIILDLICEKQTRMIKDNMYHIPEYLELEALKIKIKDL